MTRAPGSRSRRGSSSKTTRRSKCTASAISTASRNGTIAEEAADARILYQALADIGGKELAGDATRTRRRPVLRSEKGA